MSMGINDRGPRSPGSEPFYKNLKSPGEAALPRGQFLLSDVDPVKVKGRIFRIGEARYRVLSGLVSRGKKRGYIGVQVDSKGTRTGGPRYFIAIGTPVRLARVRRLDDDSVRVERKRNATRTSRRINSDAGVTLRRYCGDQAG